MTISLQRLHDMHAPVLALYGAGGRGKSALASLRNLFPKSRITVFDSFARGQFCGLEIQDITQADVSAFDFFVIASTHAQEIADTLLRLGVQRIVTYDDALGLQLQEGYRDCYPDRLATGYYALEGEADGGHVLRTLPYPDAVGGGQPEGEARSLVLQPEQALLHMYSRNTDRNRRRRPESWDLPELEPRHVAAIDRYFPAVDAGADDLARACLLMERLISLTLNLRGTPTQALDSLHPVDQLVNIVEQQERCHCSNLSNIFACVCKRHGILCRTIVCASVAQMGREQTIVFAGGHMTTEIYSQQLEKWIWMDVTLGIRQARLCGKIPLSLFLFFLFFNSPDEAAVSLQLSSTQFGSQGQGDVPLSAFSGYEQLVHYYNRNQNCRFVRSTPYYTVGDGAAED